MLFYIYKNFLHRQHTQDLYLCLRKISFDCQIIINKILEFKYLKINE